MIRFRSNSQKGSALLLVILLSGFMLVSFIAFSGTVRQAIKSQSTSYVDDLIQMDQFRESFIATGTGTLPNGYFLDTAGPIRYGALTVYSGSVENIEWKQPGTITLVRTLGAPFCYSGIDSVVGAFEGCVTQTGSVSVTAQTGSIAISTLGGYSGLSVTPVSVVPPSGVTLRIFREVGNTSFLEKILKQ